MRKIFARYLPDQSKITSHWILRKLGKMIFRQELWDFNRHAVARGVAFAFAISMLPIPLQMLFAALLAVLLRANLPIAVCGVWISNPLTIMPIFYFNYLVGLNILGEDIRASYFLFAVGSFGDFVSFIWQPLLLGSIVVGLVGGIISYFSLLLIWRVYVSYKWVGRKRAGNKGVGNKECEHKEGRNKNKKLSISKVGINDK